MFRQIQYPSYKSQAEEFDPGWNLKQVFPKYKSQQVVHKQLSAH
jgi:hypothetical protein